MEALRLEGVSKRYGRRPVLEGVSLSVRPGEVYAPGTAYRGVLEVREGLLSLAPGDQVVPWAPPTRTGPPKSSPRQPGEGNGEKGD